MIKCKNCNIKIIAYNYVIFRKDVYCLHCIYINSIKKQKFLKTIDFFK